MDTVHEPVNFHFQEILFQEEFLMINKIKVNLIPILQY